MTAPSSPAESKRSALANGEVGARERTGDRPRAEIHTALARGNIGSRKACLGVADGRSRLGEREGTFLEIVDRQRCGRARGGPDESAEYEERDYYSRLHEISHLAILPSHKPREGSGRISSKVAFAVEEGSTTRSFEAPSRSEIFRIFAT
jgi:hypothetical protein